MTNKQKIILKSLLGSSFFLITVPCLVACSQQKEETFDDYKKNIYNFQEPKDIPYAVQSYQYPLNLSNILGNTLITELTLEASSVVLEFKLIKFYEPIAQQIFSPNKSMADIAYLQMDVQNENTGEQMTWTIPVKVPDLIKERHVSYSLPTLDEASAQTDTFIWKQARFLDSESQIISQSFDCLDKPISINHSQG
ncbi:hypothetical protein OF376_02170 [Ureaplasma miroungigenitalium]|uniref:Lipoprotein n=1 Tax=Ureaplasma miroungigenitalium TaxID=1042321 RepID=A0ABT3BMW3_9BACT|nr:hypothetical protein [Ureaplasma miroungigenitalium]MCV3728569.1 hypothetical protein [Ureaplasma miroungigenitalium]MCV3734424.1 hypothetical protein [Ureaplasma miroungigenitalium]